VDIGAIKEKITGDIGREIFFFEQVSSTNTIASNFADTASDGTVFLAESQEKGRGRLGRVWISPPGVNIYMSVLLRPGIRQSEATLLTIMSAVACANAGRRITGLDISIKWPNDLILSRRKLGGILTETRTARGEVSVAITGVGLNVNMGMDAFPDDLRKIATSIRNETGRFYSREEIIAGALNEMNTWYTHLNAGGREMLLSEWRRLDSTIGREVKVIVGEEILAGFAESVDGEGRLLLRLPSGELKNISSGDLTVLL
jgi:BirA family transcriptional regulator, biotin operon repressor / biotin---[acetyl-CoA-carboxylase] ligase